MLREYTCEKARVALKRNPEMGLTCLLQEESWARDTKNGKETPSGSTTQIEDTTKMDSRNLYG
jgi:hypothetical protein